MSEKTVRKNKQKNSSGLNNNNAVSTNKPKEANGKKRIEKPRIKLSFGEEVGNAISHGAPVFILLGLFPYAVIRAYTRGNLVDVVGVSIYCISIILMLLMSALYHIMEFGTEHKRIMQMLDHIFIYVAIAGTYTPIALSIIGGWQAIVILVIQWAMVLFGILYKSLADNKVPKASLIIYLVMGWTVVLFLPQLFHYAPTPLFLLIFAGGLCYSAGAFFYAEKGVKYMHMVWHFFVLAGVACHYVGIVFFLYG
jgi:hemolysin III